MGHFKELDIERQNITAGNARYSDNPRPISLEYLTQLDRDKPDTWLAQPKLDGWRRIMYLTDQGWVFLAKHDKARVPLPENLQADLDSLGLPEGTGLDCEWVGNRQAGGKHSLVLFDLLMLDYQWLGQTGFAERYDKLTDLVLPKLGHDERPVKISTCYRNPGLVTLFHSQQHIPQSEGLVIRRADSKLIGDWSGCKDNPLWFKCKVAR